MLCEQTIKKCINIVMFEHFEQYVLMIIIVLISYFQYYNIKDFCGMIKCHGFMIILPNASQVMCTQRKLVCYYEIEQFQSSLEDPQLDIQPCTLYYIILRLQQHVLVQNCVLIVLLFLLYCIISLIMFYECIIIHCTS